jgi:hypothetical protein
MKITKWWYNDNMDLCLILQESPATIEGWTEQTQRCFTLEEAIYTILFCSSITRDIAYRAATIGLEHEQQSEFASALRPTVSLVGQSIPRSDGSLKPPHRRMSRHRKQSQKLSKMEGVGKDHVLVWPVQAAWSLQSLCRVCNASSSQRELQANGHSSEPYKKCYS